MTHHLQGAARQTELESDNESGTIENRSHINCDLSLIREREHNHNLVVINDAYNPYPAVTLIEEWELFMTGRGLSQQTISLRMGVLRGVAEQSGQNPAWLKPIDIVRWLSSRNGLAQSTLSTYARCLTAWFKWLQLQEYRHDNPMLKVGSVKTPDRAPRPISNNDLSRLLSSGIRRRTRAMVLLYGLAGLRAFEIAKVRGEDIIDGTFIRVFGKGSKERLVPLHRHLIIIAASMPTRGYWFPSDKRYPGRHIHGKTVSHTIGMAMRRAGINATPHQLRHWQGTSLLAEGVDIRVVQEIMRHASIATTAQYTKVPTSRTAEAVNRLNPFRGADASPGVALAG